MVAIVQRLEHRVVVPVMRVRFPLATQIIKDRPQWPVFYDLVYKAI